MLVFGSFLTGGSNVLFGALEYMPLPAESDQDIDVTYLVVAMVVRIAVAAGTAAVLTSSMTLLVVTFADNTTGVLVSKLHHISVC